ncbi:hypothetical protein ACFFJY_17340 [Fictibacillus aquaticus]|uniref:Uncharacterized protein n=1 Tax=Fictibacillus aquaticus TaxID=2021314 RepID=A0A235F647_9BACL|nr:hypothetical protein [Fictibacillus aquaticus]OYD56689.1 hypothetical protein CGZ90_16915 [Fictibacillus aquaticus]
MDNKIIREMNKIEIPKEARQRAILGIDLADREEKKKSPKYWIAGLAASAVILMSAITVQQTNIADADIPMLSKVFGSKEKLLELETDSEQKTMEESFVKLEQNFDLAKQYLTPQAFSDYSTLWKEWLDINTKIKSENRNVPTYEEEKRLDEIQYWIQKYDYKIKMRIHEKE